MPWLLIARPWNPATSSVVTLYLSDAGFTTEPGDAPSNTYFDRRLEEPINGQRSLFAGTDIGGEADSAIGEISCINLDGALDGWADYEWGGRVVELWYSTKAKPLMADFSLAATHTVEAITVDNEVRIRFRDLQALLDTPYQSTRFAGTGGSEGPAVLAEVRKPRPLGFPIQTEPQVVDDVARIMALGDGPIGGVTRLLDRGVELIAGPDYATEATMLAASFGSASYVSCYAAGLLRMANPPDLPLTADLAGRTRGGNLYSAGSAATVAGRWYVLRAMVTRAAGSVQPTVAGAALGSPVADTRHIVRAFTAAGASTSITFVGDGSWSGTVASIEVVEVLARAGDLIEWIVGADTDLGAGVFAAGTVAALNVACPQPLQHWHPGGDGGEVSAVITDLAQSVGAWWGANLANKLELGLFNGPAATADFTFSDRDIIDLQPEQAAERVKKVEVRFARRWRKLAETDVAGSITGDARTALLIEDEVATAADAAVATAALNAGEKSVSTLLIRRTDAVAEAARRQALLGPPRRPATAVVPFTEGLDVGKTVRLSWPRYGLASGALFVVLQAEPQITRDGIAIHSITVWR